MYGMVSISFATNSSCTPNSWREWVINTPAANRVQHASNSENLDNNSCGVLLIWDHFVWIVSGRVPGLAIRYGHVHPRRSDNPLWSPMRIFGR
jgi:hypothetical protein